MMRTFRCIRNGCNKPALNDGNTIDGCALTCSFECSVEAIEGMDRVAKVAKVPNRFNEAYCLSDSFYVDIYESN